MTIHPPLVSLSAIDEKRFGVRTAKASLVFEDIPKVIEFCSSHHVECLIARCPTTDLPAAQEMERQGFLLMDTLVYYSCNLKGKPVPEDASGLYIRPVRKGEGHAVKDIAAESFRGYLGHYHADCRLDKKKCDEVYADWAYQLCLSTKVADEVLVVDSDNMIIGFAAMHINSPSEGEIVLNGVAPSSQGKGVYRWLMISAMKWCISQDIGKIIISTQVTNAAAQKVWTRLGFELSHSYYTFHKWFS